MSVKTIELRELKNIQKEIAEFEKNRAEHQLELSNAGYTRLCNKVAFMRNCVTYLENNPRPEFVEKELERLEAKLELINNGFDTYVSGQAKRHTYKGEYLAEYSTLMGVKTIKAQIKTLKYLLNMIEI